MQIFTYIGDKSVPYRTIMANHKDFAIKDFLIKKDRCVIAEQTHSNRVHICTYDDNGAGFDKHPQISDCDALVTDIPNQYLLIRTADCTPVFLFDETKYCIGSVHSGREGTRKNIIGNAIMTMTDTYGTKPDNLKAIIGPGICNKHYQVSREIWDEFYLSCQKSNFSIDESDLLFPDIQSVILQQLTASGVKMENIKRNDICTFESGKHFSYRKNQTRNRQINIIGMTDGKHSL
jgi:YfiH family protein